jgi:crossover junction endodeoxyribonuclease RuvC
MAIRLGREAGAGPTQGGQRILGIDPGTVIMGWGVVDLVGGAISHVAHGTIGSSKGAGQENRLKQIYSGLQKVLKQYEPHGISLEKVFFARNAQSTLKLGQARGVALLAAAESKVAVHEYTSAEIKLAVVGYGRASKEQVQKMVASLLRLSEKLPADAADALAAAICYLHQRTFHVKVMGALPSGSPRLRRWKVS